MSRPAWACAALLFLLSVSAAAREPARLLVVDPFVELHSGAGRGYPVLEVVEHGTEIEVIERRTTWYRVRTVRGKEGWAPREQMLRTLTPGGEVFQEDEITEDDFRNRRFQVGAWMGDFGGSALMGLYGSWRFTPNLATEVAVQQAIGREADSLVADVSLAALPFPELSWSPYLALGTGMVETKPASVLVSAETRDDQSLSTALGVQHWVAQSFVVRLEYRQYLVLTSREDHESVDTWKAGFAVFF
ncbi:MAG: SH3 domain-containing protein [Pseudomonadota bacterium]